jgi:hypothetical protein
VSKSQAASRDARLALRFLQCIAAVFTCFRAAPNVIAERSRTPEVQAQAALLLRESAVRCWATIAADARNRMRVWLLSIAGTRVEAG